MKITKIKSACLLLLGLCGLLSSCLKNDFDYPFINGVIKEFVVEGQVGNTIIDGSRCLVKVAVADGYDIDSLKVTRWVTNKEAVIEVDSAACIRWSKFPKEGFASLAELPEAANTCMRLSQPVKVCLKTYHSFWWTLMVEQEIIRSIEVDNQVGEPLMDEQNHTALVYVSTDQSLNDITIHQLKLEGEGTRTVPAFSEVKDFTRPQQFEVYKRFKNGVEKYMGSWMVDVLQTTSKGGAEVAEVWARKAVVTGGMAQGATVMVEYKAQGASDWSQVDAEKIKYPTRTTYSANIDGLVDGTVYEWRVFVDNVLGEEGTFTTEKIVEVYNMNFDEWTQDSKGDRWYPNATAEDSYWATGNSGLSIAGKPNTTEPTTDAVRGKAAKLTTQTNILLVGAATGNLYIGSYKTNMSKPAASAQFGRPYQGARPTSMTGYYKYFPQKIDFNVNIGPATKPQTPLGTDQAHIYVQLWDEKGETIGYGELTESNTIASYTPFTIPISYSDPAAKPVKMLILVTSSKYGGEFSGMKVCGQLGSGSTLYVDEFEFQYD